MTCFMVNGLDLIFLFLWFSFITNKPEKHFVELYYLYNKKTDAFVVLAFDFYVLIKASFKYHQIGREGIKN